MDKKAQDAVWRYGPTKLSKELTDQRTPGAVYAWLKGRSFPRFEAAKEIVKLVNKTLSKDEQITVENLMAKPVTDPLVPRIDRRRLPKSTKPTKP